MKNNHICRIEIGLLDDVTFYFNNDPFNPISYKEFEKESITRNVLHELQWRILMANDKLE